MPLIKLVINEVLLLMDFNFSDSNNDIDSLNQQAAEADDDALKLELLTKAIHMVEKFHSFFHFEQSYFHTQLAILYRRNNDEEKAGEQLKAAVFQDHVNMQAKGLLSGEEWAEEYARPYSTFTDYLTFAANEQVASAQGQSYWAIAPDTAEGLEKIIQMIRLHHLGYHQEAAKLYLNRALVFHRMGQNELAKNDIIKACNLDNALQQKDYYLGVLAEVNKVE